MLALSKKLWNKHTQITKANRHYKQEVAMTMTAFIKKCDCLIFDA